MPTVKISLIGFDGQSNHSIERDAEEVNGAFAIIKEGRGSYNITHIPTGNRVFGTGSKDRARKAVAFMSDGLNWEFGRFGVAAKGKRYAKFRQRAQEAFKKFG